VVITPVLVAQASLAKASTVAETQVVALPVAVAAAKVLLAVTQPSAAMASLETAEQVLQTHSALVQTLPMQVVAVVLVLQAALWAQEVLAVAAQAATPA
jgi:predicted SPOUT superfamily RNA methylase MTH1